MRRRKISSSAIANRPRLKTKRRHPDTLKAPPVSLITVSIPVQFQITNVLAWVYNNADPTNLLRDLATREVVHYLAGVDLNDVMSHTRLEAAQDLHSQIQAAVDEYHSAPGSFSSGCRTFIRR